MTHEEKFAGLYRCCAEVKETKADVLVIHSPVVLGDTYEELTKNLDYIAEAGLGLHIVPPSRRGPTR